jgi:hypothetical protein
MFLYTLYFCSVTPWRWWRLIATCRSYNQLCVKKYNFEISFIVWITYCFEKTTWSRILFLWGVAPYYRIICSRQFSGTHRLLRGSSQAVCSIEMSETACPSSDATSSQKNLFLTHTVLKIQDLLRQVQLQKSFHSGTASQWVGVHSEVLQLMLILRYVNRGSCFAEGRRGVCSMNSILYNTLPYFVYICINSCLIWTFYNKRRFWKKFLNLRLK